MKHKASSTICIKNGFTLIETIVVVAIFSLVMVGMSTMFATLYKQQHADVVRLESLQIAGRVIEIMSSEVRKINRAEDGSSPIKLADEQDLEFYSDIDNDGLTEEVQYYLDGTNIRKTVTEPGASLDYSGSGTTTTIARNIINDAVPLFVYYDEDYLVPETPTPLPYPANVTKVNLIEINLFINPDSSYISNPLFVTTKIHPRNLKILN